jgi:hypothetical protein
MDQRFYNLEAINPHQGRVVEFTRPDDARWSGVVELLPGQVFATPSGLRTDIYVLYGEVVRGDGEVTAIGDFLSVYDDIQLTGAFGGAVLLVYREPVAERRTLVNLPAAERSWRAARVQGMHVASLTATDYQLALFHWGPGIYVPPHINPYGEELFVLSGELHVNGQALPAGSWLRLGAGERHDSGSEKEALILLRSGHLVPLQ